MKFDDADINKNIMHFTCLPGQDMCTFQSFPLCTLKESVENIETNLMPYKKQCKTPLIFFFQNGSIPATKALSKLELGTKR